MPTISYGSLMKYWIVHPKEQTLLIYSLVNRIFQPSKLYHSCILALKSMGSAEAELNDGGAKFAKIRPMRVEIHCIHWNGLPRIKLATKQTYKRCMQRLHTTIKTSSNECNVLQRTAGRLLNWKWYSPSKKKCYNASMLQCFNDWYCCHNRLVRQLDWWENWAIFDHNYHFWGSIA